MADKIEKMRHALGVQRRGGKWTAPYRNHFTAGEGDVAVWEELVREGHARRTREPSELTGDCPVYSVTASGRELALAGIPKLKSRAR